MPIPREIHLIWLGNRLPALAWLAIRSMLDRAGAQRVLLHSQSPDIGREPLVADLLRHPDFALDLSTPALDGLPDRVVARLDALRQALHQPAARADLLRLEILWAHGGLYVDTDVIALRDLAALWPLDGVAGLEQVCLPAHVVHSHSPLTWARAGVLLGVREWVRRQADAARLFRPLAPLYDEACNNAVLGFAPRAPLLGRLLERAAWLPAAQALRLYELGPRLLEAETGNVGTPALCLLPPAAFYPLAPEICGALLRPRPHGQPLAPEPQALVVHLYDSVLRRQLGQPLDAAWLLGAGRHSWLAELVAPWLDDLAHLTRRAEA